MQHELSTACILTKRISDMFHTSAKVPLGIVVKRLLFCDLSEAIGEVCDEVVVLRFEHGDGARAGGRRKHGARATSACESPRDMAR